MSGTGLACGPRAFRRVATTLVAGLVLMACAGSDRVATTADPPAATGDRDAPAPTTLPLGLRDAPSALEDPRADGLPAATIDLDRLRAGGPPPDGIPPIDDPHYTRADAVDFLADREPVLVVTVAGDTRIFPVQIMTWHEIVNDTMGGIPVTVSYCPLCNSAITYDRRIATPGGDTLTVDFGTSGLLYNSALVMYDRQTESLWSHFSGAAVAGVLTGTELHSFPSTTVGWAAARDAFPEAPVLDRTTGHDRDYGRNPYGGYDDVTTSPVLYDGVADGRLAAKTRVVGIRRGGDAVAVRTDALDLPDVVDVTVGGEPLTVWRAAGTASALDTPAIAEGRDVGATGVFARDLDGRRLSFTAHDGGFVDDETGSTWTILGAAVDGPLEGAQLATVTHVDTFWFAWAAFLPDTAVVPSP